MNGTVRPDVVVITGASAGVGRAAAHAFAKRGARIGLLARGVERLQAAKREVENIGGKGLVLPADVSRPDQVEAAAEEVEKEFGPIDIWVNNAMTSVLSPVKQMEPEEYRRVTEVIYLGYVHGALAALKRMLPRDRGVIIQVGSALAYRGIPLQSSYCAAKHAIQGFNDSLRAELIHDKSKVRLASVQLPAMNTPQFGWVKSRLPKKARPVPPVYQPEVAAEAIVATAYGKKKEVYVGWSTIIAIIGNKFFPRLGDWYLGKTGYESQQYDGPDDPNRPNNLWEPPPGDPGVHGSFGDRAKGRAFTW